MELNYDLYMERIKKMENRLATLKRIVKKMNGISIAHPGNAISFSVSRAKYNSRGKLLRGDSITGVEVGTNDRIDEFGYRVFDDGYVVRCGLLRGSGNGLDAAVIVCDGSIIFIADLLEDILVRFGVDMERLVS